MENVGGDESLKNVSENVAKVTTINKLICFSFHH